MLPIKMLTPDGSTLLEAYLEQVRSRQDIDGEVGYYLRHLVGTLKSLAVGSCWYWGKEDAFIKVDD